MLPFHWKESFNVRLITLHHATYCNHHSKSGQMHPKWWFASNSVKTRLFFLYPVTFLVRKMLFGNGEIDTYGCRIRKTISSIFIKDRKSIALMYNQQNQQSEDFFLVKLSCFNHNVAYRQGKQVCNRHRCKSIESQPFVVQDSINCIVVVSLCLNPPITRCEIYNNKFRLLTPLYESDTNFQKTQYQF